MAKLEEVLYRLQVHVLPRIRELDSTAVASAIRDGEADFEESRLQADRCATGCDALHPNCDAACNDNALLGRISACENPVWLAP